MVRILEFAFGLLLIAGFIWYVVFIMKKTIKPMAPDDGYGAPRPERGRERPEPVEPMPTPHRSEKAPDTASAGPDTATREAVSDGSGDVQPTTPKPIP